MDFIDKSPFHWHQTHTTYTRVTIITNCKMYSPTFSVHAIFLCQNRKIVISFFRHSLKLLKNLYAIRFNLVRIRFVSHFFFFFVIYYYILYVLYYYWIIPRWRTEDKKNFNLFFSSLVTKQYKQIDRPHQFFFNSASAIIFHIHWNQSFVTK